jgi:hypothetical protein
MFRAWIVGVREREGHPRRPARRNERNPDERSLETLDDWILFGPRLR